MRRYTLKKNGKIITTTINTVCTRLHRYNIPLVGSNIITSNITITTCISIIATVLFLLSARKKASHNNNKSYHWI